jgi:aryl-alcohol dehydrogenase-like predicted oxidoreductase
MSPLVAQSPTPRVILGLMTFGPDESTGARITDVGEFAKVLDRFQSRGYNEVDTARLYVGGKQEAFTREAGWKDRGLTLATKIKYPAQPGENTYDKVLQSMDLSLSELGAECVDILYLHAAVSDLSPIPSTPSPFPDDGHRTAQRPSPNPSAPSTTSTKPASSSALASPTSPPSKSPRSS